MYYINVYECIVESNTRGSRAFHIFYFYIYSTLDHEYFKTVYHCFWRFNQGLIECTRLRGFKTTSVHLTIYSRIYLLRTPTVGVSKVKASGSLNNIKRNIILAQEEAYGG